jgi:hypothetical protein
LQLVKKFPAVVEPESSLPYSQVPTTLTVSLYDIKLPVAIEEEADWAPEPVWSLERRDGENPVASGDGNRWNGISEA